ncbi:hypothetical protein M413DRAFT_437751, partial [Hebeloma cylindrosporum]
MSDTDDEMEITRLLPFFNPSPQFATPNPTSAAKTKSHPAPQIRANLSGAFATDLPTSLPYIAAVHL